MKKIVILSSLFVLSACVSPVVYFYEGDKQVKGEGGFYDGVLSADRIVHSVFEPSPNYKYQTVDIYASGLPKNTTCTLLGYVSCTDHSKLSKIVFGMGANVITRSSVSMPIKFENSDGFLDVSMDAGIVNVTSFGSWGASTRSVYKYNVFECK